MANMAMAYGSSIASQGKDIVHKEVWPVLRRVAGFLGCCGSPLTPQAAFRKEECGLSTAPSFTSSCIVLSL